MAEVEDRGVTDAVPVSRYGPVSRRPGDLSGRARCTRHVSTRDAAGPAAGTVDECREPFINIYTRTQGEERLVTTIEVLSRANKTPGEKAQDLYMKKQEEILDSPVSLIEIDLLRGGEPTTVGRKWWRKYGKSFDYHVCLCPSYTINRYAYPFRLADMPPEIAVPLLEEDGAFAVDLQEVFNRAYDTGPYRRRVRYGMDKLNPPLTAEQQAWHDDVLQKAHAAQP